MLVIWKYPLYLHPGRTEHDMPIGAKVLTVQIQGTEPCLWALVNPEARMEHRIFESYGTGHGMPKDPGRYVATFQTDGGALVWHVFDMQRQIIETNFRPMEA